MINKRALTAIYLLTIIIQAASVNGGVNTGVGQPHQKDSGQKSPERIKHTSKYKDVSATFDFGTICHWGKFSYLLVMSTKTRFKYAEYLMQQRHAEFSKTKGQNFVGFDKLNQVGPNDNWKVSLEMLEKSMAITQERTKKLKAAISVAQSEANIYNSNLQIEIDFTTAFFDLIYDQLNEVRKVLNTGMRKGKKYGNVKAIDELKKITIDHYAHAKTKNNNAYIDLFKDSGTGKDKVYGSMMSFIQHKYKGHIEIKVNRLSTILYKMFRINTTCAKYIEIYKDVIEEIIGDTIDMYFYLSDDAENHMDQMNNLGLIFGLFQSLEINENTCGGSGFKIEFNKIIIHRIAQDTDVDNVRLQKLKKLLEDFEQGQIDEDLRRIINLDWTFASNENKFQDIGQITRDIENYGGLDLTIIKFILEIEINIKDIDSRIIGKGNLKKKDKNGVKTDIKSIFGKAYEEETIKASTILIYKLYVLWRNKLYRDNLSKLTGIKADDFEKTHEKEKFLNFLFSFMINYHENIKPKTGGSGQPGKEQFSEDFLDELMKFIPKNDYYNNFMIIGLVINSQINNGDKKQGFDDIDNLNKRLEEHKEKVKDIYKSVDSSTTKLPKVLRFKFSNYSEAFQENLKNELEQLNAKLKDIYQKKKRRFAQKEEEYEQEEAIFEDLTRDSNSNADQQRIPGNNLSTGKLSTQISGGGARQEQTGNKLEVVSKNNDNQRGGINIQEKKQITTITRTERSSPKNGKIPDVDERTNEKHNSNIGGSITTNKKSEQTIDETIKEYFLHILDNYMKISKANLRDKKEDQKEQTLDQICNQEIVKITVEQVIEDIEYQNDKLRKSNTLEPHEFLDLKVVTNFEKSIEIKKKSISASESPELQRLIRFENSVKLCLLKSEKYQIKSDDSDSIVKFFNNIEKVKKERGKGGSIELSIEDNTKLSANMGGNGKSASAGKVKNDNYLKLHSKFSTAKLELSALDKEFFNLMNPNKGATSKSTRTNIRNRFDLSGSKNPQQNVSKNIAIDLLTLTKFSIMKLAGMKYLHKLKCVIQKFGSIDVSGDVSKITPANENHLLLVREKFYEVLTEVRVKNFIDIIEKDSIEDLNRAINELKKEKLKSVLLAPDSFTLESQVDYFLLESVSFFAGYFSYDCLVEARVASGADGNQKIEDYIGRELNLLDGSVRNNENDRSILSYINDNDLGGAIFDLTEFIIYYFSRREDKSQNLRTANNEIKNKCELSKSCDGNKSKSRFCRFCQQLHLFDDLRTDKSERDLTLWDIIISNNGSSREEYLKQNKGLLFSFFVHFNHRNAVFSNLDEVHQYMNGNIPPRRDLGLLGKEIMEKSDYVGRVKCLRLTETHNKDIEWFSYYLALRFNTVHNYNSLALSEAFSSNFTTDEDIRKVFQEIGEIEDVILRKIKHQRMHEVFLLLSQSAAQRLSISREAIRSNAYSSFSTISTNVITNNELYLDLEKFARDSVVGINSTSQIVHKQPVEDVKRIIRDYIQKGNSKLAAKTTSEQKLISGTQIVEENARKGLIGGQNFPSQGAGSQNESSQIINNGKDIQMTKKTIQNVSNFSLSSGNRIKGSSVSQTTVNHKVKEQIDQNIGNNTNSKDIGTEGVTKKTEISVENRKQVPFDTNQQLPGQNRSQSGTSQIKTGTIVINSQKASQHGKNTNISNKIGNANTEPSSSPTVYIYKDPNSQKSSTWNSSTRTDNSKTMTKSQMSVSDPIDNSKTSNSSSQQSQISSKNFNQSQTDNKFSAIRAYSQRSNLSGSNFSRSKMISVRITHDCRCNQNDPGCYLECEKKIIAKFRTQMDKIDFQHEIQKEEAGSFIDYSIQQL